MPPPTARTVVPVLGLPFDVITLEEAADRITQATQSRQRLFLSTPNLNFAVSALSDRLLRDSVLSSDLSVVDGMPLVWLSRILGTPLPERVSGSDLFAALSARSTDTPIKVYLFGGEDGAAAAASREINRRAGGTRCVGFSSPGFGSVEDMSAAAYIDAINASDADMLIVAVSARKGQAWIMRNLERLAPPVVCYLGAVINFESGRVRRAPAILSKLGLEWAWRISQEPSLYRRYVSDGMTLLSLVVRQIIPLVFRRVFQRKVTATPGSLTIAGTGNRWVASVSGKFDAALGMEIVKALDSASPQLPPAFDLSATTSIGPEGVASCMVSKGIAIRRRTDLVIENASDQVRRTVTLSGAAYLLDPATRN